MPAKPNCVVLIGMPGAGKSTAGILLAKELGLGFLDTDIVIQVQEKKSLQQIIDEQGYLALRRIEEQVLLATDCAGLVVATGGSAVYSGPGMRHLRAFGPVIYLDVPLAELTRRIDDYASRGIARCPQQSFESLFEERSSLYHRYADYHLNCATRNPREVVAQIVRSCLSGVVPKRVDH